MSDLREKIAEWKRLAEAATPGPWRAGNRHFAHVVNDGDVALAICNTNENAKFITAARKAVPALVARVEELEKEVRRHRDLYEQAYTATGIGMVRASKEQVSRALAGYQHDLEDAQASISKLKARVEERESDIHERIRAEYDCTIAEAWRDEVARRDRRIAELEARIRGLGGELDAERACRREDADRIAELEAADAAEEDLRELVLDRLPYVYDDGEDPPNEASAEEGIEYAAEELKRLRKRIAELEAVLAVAVADERCSLWNRCFDCDHPEKCRALGSERCIVGERNHKWLQKAEATLDEFDIPKPEGE